MAEILSLSKARKSRARAEAKQTAEENRVRFGRTRAERETREKTADLADRRLEGHRREGAEGDDEV